MYLKLGKTKINYSTPIHNDFFIMSEIIDSQLSYEKPIIVRTLEELDLWFGKNFSSYSYLQYLLKNGVSLYLYKPISTFLTKNRDYIDLTNYTVFNIYNNIDSLPISGESGYYYIVINSVSQYKTTKYQGISYDCIHYVWYNNMWVDIENLPELDISSYVFSNSTYFNIQELPEQGLENTIYVVLIRKSIYKK